MKFSNDLCTMDIRCVIWKYYFCFYLIISISGCNGLCEFPTSLQGLHMLSRSNSLVNVTLNHIDGIRLLEAPNLENRIGTNYECVTNTSNRFVLRSVKGAREPSDTEDRHVYFCMDLTEISQAKATYVQATNTGPGTKPYDSKYLTATVIGAHPFSAVCDIPQSSYTPSKYSVFLKISEETSWPQTCPTDILGVYTNHDPLCPAMADVCTDNRYIQLDNTTSCAVAPFFSANGSVACVHDVQDGNTTYLHLYNNDNDVDNINTYRYTCVALEKTDGGVLMSQNPGDCIANQKPDTATTSGKTTFNFSQPDTSKLCPITTTRAFIVNTTTTAATTTSVTTSGLDTAASVGLALGLLGLLALLVLLVLCVLVKRRKKKRKKMEEEVRRREEGRLERRRRRRERRLKRMQKGLAPPGDGSDSSDSGYSGRSTATLAKSEEEEAEDERPDREKMEEKGEKREEEQSLRRTKVRRIYDEQGNFLYEEDIPESDEDGDRDEDGNESTTEGKRKQRRKKKTRKYVREKTLPDGTVVKEMVESEYWSSDSERSAKSWQDDPVRTQIHMAKIKRKRDRRSMMERSAGNTVSSYVKRPEVERNHSPDRSLFTLPKLFHKLAHGKRKLPEDVSDVDHDIPDSDRFLPQYHDKKQTEWRLEDEGFWDDPKSKTSALEIFDFDNLDAQLDESVKLAQSRDDTRVSSEMRSDDQTQESQEKSEVGQESRPSSRGRYSSHSRESKKSRLPTIEGPSSFVSGSHDDTCEELPSTVIHPEHKLHGKKVHDRQRILASLSRLLTDRLFSQDGERRVADTPQSGRVIFVDECEDNRPLSQSRPGSRSGSQRTRPHSQNSQDPDDNRNTVNMAPETSQSLELPPLSGQGHSRHRYTSHGRRGIGPERAAILRQGLLKNRNFVGHLVRTPRPRQAWTDSQLQSQNDDISSKRWWLQQKGPCEHDDSSLDGIQYTRTSRDQGYLDLDDARLRRLLEELYKDKKYMDRLVAAEASSSRDDVKALAEHGRDYLLQMALYWEQKGPLPPRPSTTALGFKLERARSANTRRAQTARVPKMERNETFC